MTTSWLQIAGYSFGFAALVLVMAGAFVVMAALDMDRWDR